MFGWSISARACRSASKRAITCRRVHARLDDLQRDAALDRLGLLGHVDDAHAAFADLLQQLVGADLRAGLFASRGRRSHRARLASAWSSGPSEAVDARLSSCSRLAAGGPRRRKGSLDVRDSLLASRFLERRLRKSVFFGMERALRSYDDPRSLEQCEIRRGKSPHGFSEILQDINRPSGQLGMQPGPGVSPVPVGSCGEMPRAAAASGMVRPAK